MQIEKGKKAFCFAHGSVGVVQKGNGGNLRNPNVVMNFANSDTVSSHAPVFCLARDVLMIAGIEISPMVESSLWFNLRFVDRLPYCVSIELTGQKFVLRDCRRSPEGNEEQNLDLTEQGVRDWLRDIILTLGESEVTDDLYALMKLRILEWIKAGTTLSSVKFSEMRSVIQHSRCVEFYASFLLFPTISILDVNDLAILAMLLGSSVLSNTDGLLRLINPLHINQDSQPSDSQEGRKWMITYIVSILEAVVLRKKR